MIATLRGTVAEKSLSMVVLDVQGVGYGLYVTTEDFGNLAPGALAKVYVYEYIREQSHDLYGFVSADTKRLFEQLLEVNGVGPKMALSLLSTGTTAQVRSAIAGGELKFIQQANGIGKRVAERIVVELKDKVGLAAVTLAETGLLQSDNLLLGDEAVEALVALGYTAHDAAEALRPIDDTLPTAERVSRALKQGRP